MLQKYIDNSLNQLTNVIIFRCDKSGMINYTNKAKTR